MKQQSQSNGQSLDCPNPGLFSTCALKTLTPSSTRPVYPSLLNFPPRPSSTHDAFADEVVVELLVPNVSSKIDLVLPDFLFDVLCCMPLSLSPSSCCRCCLRNFFAFIVSSFSFISFFFFSTNNESISSRPPDFRFFLFIKSSSFFVEEGGYFLFLLILSFVVVVVVDFFGYYFFSRFGHYFFQ